MKDILTKGSFEWYTPPEVLAPLGEFDLDPCYPIKPIHKTANHTFNILDDGLFQNWFGRVWLNPPYGRELGNWMHKMALHGNGIALIFARTETKVFHSFVFPVASSILFLKGRLFFIDDRGVQAKSNSGAPSVLIAYGDHNSDVLSSCGHAGKHVPLVSRVYLLNFNRSWKLVISSVIVDEKTLDEIYHAVETIAPDKVQRNRHYKAKIRQTLQRYFKRTKPSTYTR